MNIKLPLVIFTLLGHVYAQSGSPTGVVLETSASQLKRAGTELPIALLPGDLLYTGDQIVAGGSVKLWFCPSREELLLENGSSLTTRATDVVLQGSNVRRRAIEYCVLPSVERALPPGTSFLGSRMERTGDVPRGEGLNERIQKLPAQRRTEIVRLLAPIDAAIARNPADAAAHSARGAILQQFELHEFAADEFKQVSGIWSSVDWPRILVHRQEDKERQASTAIQTVAGTGKVYALLVGVSDYGPGVGLNLMYAHRDAEDFERFLLSPKGGSIPRSQIKVLTNNRATLSNILTEMNGFLKVKVRAEDSVILFFAAHGIADSRDAYMLAYDSNPSDLRTTALPMATIQEMVRDKFRGAARVLVYADVCRAGSIGAIKVNHIGSVVSQVLSGPQINGLLASGPDENSYEGDRYGGGHGAFTYFLLGGLNGDADENKDGRVYADELFEHVRKRVREITEHKQNPHMLRDMPTTLLLVDDTKKVGIQLRPLGDLVAQGDRATRGLEEPEALQLNQAIQDGRILPADSNSAFDWLRRRQARQLGRQNVIPSENELWVALLDRGQEVILRYLQGDEAPQGIDDFLRGEQLYRAALQLDPDAFAIESRALFCGGRARIFEKRYGDAVQMLERATRIDPQGAYNYNALGIAYLELADFQRAIAAFRDAIRMAPYWAYPRHNLALALGERGDVVASIAAYQEGMSLKPTNWSLPYNLGLAYQRIGERSKAEALFRKSSTLAPKSPEPLNALGLLSANRKKVSKAEKQYRAALALQPEYLPSRHNLALLTVRQKGRTDEAIQAWRWILALNPEYLPSRLSLAETFAALGRTTEAAHEFEEIIKVRPDYLNAQLALMQVLAAEMKWSEVALKAAQALKRWPAHPAVLEMAGDAEAGLSHRQEAQGYYRSALARPLDPASKKRISRKLERF